MKRIAMALAAVAVFAGGGGLSDASAWPAVDAGLFAALTTPGSSVEAARLVCDVHGCRHGGVRQWRGAYTYFRPYGYYRPYGRRPFYYPPQISVDDLYWG